mmetsp:Transcript_107570/g.309624  ORF Transcript_107570/g.309624 Transcript_107570/m.309624 type:complete len:417 (-) Transcript_107570:99-1349(-)
MAQAKPLTRTGTFFAERQQQLDNLAALQRREQHLAEVYTKNKPLCFSGAAYQKTHPVKAQRGRKDADVTLSTPSVLGVADGVSQIEDFGIDASLLPKELLRRCEALGERQLRPGAPEGSYRGPIPLVRQAFEGTAPILGSTTLVLAVLDNSTKIHGKLHPMVAVISIGDCELLLLRRVHGLSTKFEAVFQTEMQRIDGNLQTPLQLARVDDRIDSSFHDGITIEVIERGSAVHCVSAYEGDIVVMGSDGVFDNLFVDEVVDIVNSILRPGTQYPAEESMLAFAAKRIVEACHAKTMPGPMGTLPDAPIGRGGKIDDTSCVVAEVVELLDSSDLGRDAASRDFEDEDESIGAFLGCGAVCNATEHEDFDVGSGACGVGGGGRKQRSQPKGGRRHHRRPAESEVSEEDDGGRGGCCIA